MLPKGIVNEFRSIYLEETEESLSTQESAEMANRFISLMRTVYRPMLQERIERPMTKNDEMLKGTPTNDQLSAIRPVFGTHLSPRSRERQKGLFERRTEMPTPKVAALEAWGEIAMEGPFSERVRGLEKVARDELGEAVRIRRQRRSKSISARLPEIDNENRLGGNPKMQETMKDHYETKDLMFASALLAKGIPLLDAEDSGGYLVFHFDNPDKCQKIERAWWSGELLVNAQRYAEAIKRLKGLVHSRSYSRRGD